MSAINKRRIITILAAALTLTTVIGNVSFAATAKRNSRLNGGLTDHIGNAECEAIVYMWHSSSSSSRNRWELKTENQDLGPTVRTIYNSDIPSYFNGSKTNDHPIVVYLALPQQANKMAGIYGIENTGIQFNVAQSGAVSYDNIEFQKSGSNLWLKYTPILKTSNTTLWQNGAIWNKFNTYGRIPIPTVASGYGSNYLSATRHGVSGSIKVNSAAVRNAYVSGNNVYFSGTDDVMFNYSPAKLNEIVAGTHILGGGAHGVYFEQPIKVDFYDTNVYSKTPVISGHEYSSGGTYWVKAGDNFTIKSEGYTNGDSSIVKVNANILDITSGGSTSTLDSKTTYNNNSIAHFKNNSSNLNFVNGNGSRSGKNLVTNFNVNMSGNKDIVVKNRAQLNHFTGNYDSNSGLYKEASSSTVAIKSDADAPSITFSSSPNWATTNQNISVTVTDGRSGVKSSSLRYRLNGGAWSSPQSSLSLSLTSSGTYEIEVTTEDNVGNKRTLSKTYTIDKEAPKFSGIPSSDWSGVDKTFTITSTDNAGGSGVSSLALYKNGSKVKDGTRNSNGTYSVTHTETANGSQRYEVTSSDAAGLSASSSFTIRVDKIQPVISNPPSEAWSKQNVVINLTTTDNPNGPSGSGIKSFVISRNGSNLNGNVSGNSGTFTYTESQEGNNSYVAKSTDNSNPSNMTTRNFNIKVDKSTPTYTPSVSKTTTNKEVSITFNNLTDAYSGVKEVWISESQNFSGATQKYTTGNTSSVSFKFRLGDRGTPESHYSERTIYIRVFDVAGNYLDKSIKTTLLPNASKSVTITSPTENKLHLINEPLRLSWQIDKNGNDFTLPQKHAEITITDTKTQKVYKYTHIQTPSSSNDNNKVEIHDKVLLDLPEGYYKVQVRSFNWDNVYTDSNIVNFRINKFKPNGVVYTKDILIPSYINYLDFVTINKRPANTEIKGTVYYKTDSSGNILLTDGIPFKIKEQATYSQPVRLPVATKKIKVKYELINNGAPTIDNITPILEHIKIYGR